jgi:tetratricopeptide (TPR) repeat protein
VWAEKVPFLLLAAGAAVVAFHALAALGNMKPLADMGLPVRLVLSVYGLAFYLEKTLLPMGLLPLYQFPVQVTYFHFAAVAAATALAVVLRRRWPAFTAVWAVYVATLVPVLGLFQNGPQIVADRYSYLACLGWALLAGALAAWNRRGAAVTRAVIATWLVVLATLAWQQAGIWQDSISLWRHAVTHNPRSRAAHGNLAEGYETAGRFADAERHYFSALALSSAKAPWLSSLGKLYERWGRPEDARRAYSEALRDRPRFPEGCEAARALLARTGLRADGLDGCPAR